MDSFFSVDGLLGGLGSLFGDYYYDDYSYYSYYDDYYYNDYSYYDDYDSYFSVGGGLDWLFGDDWLGGMFDDLSYLFDDYYYNDYYYNDYYYDYKYYFHFY